MEKKKLLFFLQIPWSWIKQRPQFLAEELSGYFDVTVVTIDVLGSGKPHSNSGVHFWSIKRLPLERFPLIRAISKFLIRLQLLIKQKEFDYVWLTSPMQLSIAKRFINKVVIYDCMDDHLSFSKDKTLNDLKFYNEKELYEKAILVICSSEYLKRKLKERYGNKDIIVVNNAIADYLLDKSYKLNNTTSIELPHDQFNISYIGTIAEWFDFDLVLKLLESIPSVTFHLFGPSVIRVPNHDRIVYHGIIKHEDVFPVMKSSNALIMPFVVTELIKSVNPVKLYEYIASGRPCIAPSYGESMPFSEYVHLYEDYQQCNEIVLSIMKNAPEKTIEEKQRFVQNNTWHSRAVEIVTKIERL